MIQSTQNTSPVSMVVLPKSEWEAIKDKLEEISSLVINRNTDEANTSWIESSEARRLLGVSQTTWQNLRDERKIPFSQYGRKIYVKKADIQAFMETHYVNAVK